MSTSNKLQTDEQDGSTYREYILDVRIVEFRPSDEDDLRYRFEAPGHQGRAFEDPEAAQLYADVYFDVNGFEEAGTGDRGIPPTVFQGGRDTLAAYLLAQPGIDRSWVASFLGKKPARIERYVAGVRNRAEEIRQGAKDRVHN